MTVDPSSFKTTPFSHQAEELVRSAEDRSRALFWEQGTGKTWYGIAATAHNRRIGKIGAALIVAPSGVERNWITDELPAHMPDDVRWEGHVWSSDKAGTKHHQRAVERLLKLPPSVLPVLSMTYDAWLTQKGKQAAWDLMRTRRTFLHVDESHHLKTYSSERTKSVTKAAPYAALTRIYTGTPIDLPFDIYAQVNVVDPTFWQRELGFWTFSDFKAFFGVFGLGTRGYGENERNFPILVSYQNLAVLRDLLGKLGSRVLKDDVLDLPEKLYTRRYYEMSPAQTRMYEALEQEFMADFPDDPDSWVTAELPIVRMLRLQQVLCGYVPADEDEEPRQLIDPKRNPRLDATTEFITEAGNSQTVISAVYRLDIDLIMERLRAEGRKPVRYDGAVTEEERARAKAGFKAGDYSDLVLNPSVGAEGLTFTNAHTMAFHSNNYRMIKRKQTEDRIHRIGQTHSCLYGDMVCPGTRDERAIERLAYKHRVSQTVLGDAPKKWL